MLRVDRNTNIEPVRKLAEDRGATFEPTRKASAELLRFTVGHARGTISRRRNGTLNLTGLAADYFQELQRAKAGRRPNE